jgi:hypothetical protein
MAATNAYFSLIMAEREGKETSELREKSVE